MVRKTFTDSENAEEADLVVRLIEEIRSMSTYVPELELVMVNDEDEVIGYREVSPCISPVFLRLSSMIVYWFLYLVPQSQSSAI